MYITYYLIAAASLLPALKRLTVIGRQRSTRQLFDINCISVYIGTSPYLSSIICSSTSGTSLFLLLDLFFPSFVYIFVSNGVFLYLTFVVTLALLDDLFFCILLYTLVNGLPDIFLGFACFLLGIFLDNFVLAGLYAANFCHTGLLFSFANSFTLFMLWSMTGRSPPKHPFLQLLVCIF
jgi:hypothetical protein